MLRVIGFKYMECGRIYYADCGQLELEVGTPCIVKVFKRQELAQVVHGPRMAARDGLGRELGKVIRIASYEDIKRWRENKKQEQEAFAVCVRRIRSQNLPIKLVRAHYSQDCTRLSFYFTASGPVDHRKLANELSGVFKVKVVVKQIGVRDNARMLGALGICGRPLCCSLFLQEFQPVAIKMAKQQGLPLSPAKISGLCGRLMCCLTYEDPIYTELSRKLPKLKSSVNTKYGIGKVIELDVLKGKLKVELRDTGNKIELAAHELAD